MGGNSEFTIGDLRVHESNGDIHIHDDKKNIKLAISAADFKREYADLKSSIEDGVVKKAMISRGDMKLTAEQDKGQVSWTLGRSCAGFSEFDAFVSKI